MISDTPTTIWYIGLAESPVRPTYMSATMYANSPICASPNPVWTASLTFCPVRRDIVKQLKPFPHSTSSESPRIAGR